MDSHPFSKFLIKLGTKIVDSFLNLADSNFVEDVNDDLKKFLSEKRAESVLIFPPVSNYRRFLIHKCVENLKRLDLATFSIGVCDERRTVVCYKERILRDEACAHPLTVMGLTPAEHDDATISRNDAANTVGGCKPALAQPTEKIRPTRPRRPDRAVYVPRALRSAENNQTPEEAKNSNNRKRTNHNNEAKCTNSPSLKHISQPTTPKKYIDKTFCNIYTPPPLRNHRSHTTPSIEHQTTNDTVPLVCQVPNSAISFSDNSYKDVEVGDNFYIGHYFVNGELGLYSPSYDCTDYIRHNTNSSADESEYMNMAVPESNQSNIIVSSDYIYKKDEDNDYENELKKASQEINRSSKRLIKQSFNSDVLVISDPIKIVKEEEKKEIVDVKEPEPKKKEKQKLEPKVSLKREENDWDSVFDDSGECLDPSLLEELNATVGKVHISKAKNNYEQYQTRGQALFNGPFDENFAHVIEVFSFPSEFKTNDLLSVFSEYKDTGFEIKWVDDTHALIVFSSAKIAAEVLSTPRPLVKCRPLYAATIESRNKAKKCAEFLQPYRQRPETCTALARRLVSGALGVKLSTAQQERAEERRLITIAREKKRQAALHKEAAWEGSLANQRTGDD